MNFTLKTKIFNKSLFVFLFLAVFSFGFLALADEQEVITTFLDDTDQDGLSTEEEKAYGTDPSNNDTDGDSYSDGVEIESGYDPLKPAPGDRIVPDIAPAEGEVANGVAETSVETVNLTDIATEELANIVSEKQDANQELTNEDLNSVVLNVLEQSNVEVELPEVDISNIKVKEISDGLNDEEEKEQKRQDTIEYLTTAGYIILSNVPATIRSDADLLRFTENTAREAVVGITTGNYTMVENFEKKSKVVLEELNGMEVPENMVDTHLKAVQLVKFVEAMGSKIKTVNLSDDLIGQMSELAKVQGALFQIQNFILDSNKIMTDLSIRNIDIDF